MNKMQIFTDSCSDMPEDLRNKYNIDYFRMTFSINEKERYADLDYKEYSFEEMYQWIGDTSNRCKTSMVTVEEFVNKMTPYLEKGLDIFYIATTLKLTASFNVFLMAKKELEAKYPNCRIEGIDSNRVGMTLGLLVIDCAKKRDEGQSIDELIEYINAEKWNYCLVATVATLTYLAKAGRVSGASKFFGNMIGVKPIIASDRPGHNVVLEKTIGAKKSLDKLFEYTKQYMDEENKLICIGQGAASSSSSYLKERFEKELGATVLEYRIGPIIGISCGPGVIHICFHGHEMDVPIEEN